MTSGNSNVLQRLFITGVSPITMDDVSSGFNIGTNISIELTYSNMLGFTEKDVCEMIDYYTSVGVFKLDKEESITVLKKWYDNYKFSEDSIDTVFNSTGVLNFMFFTKNKTKFPSDIIDENLRMDSTKLKYLVYQGTTLNGNFDALTEIISNGGVFSKIKRSFPFEMLKKKENYVSLLYFFGFLTFSGKFKEGKPYLTIPNETINHLVYEYMRRNFEDSI